MNMDQCCAKPLAQGEKGIKHDKHEKKLKKGLFNSLVKEKVTHWKIQPKAEKRPEPVSQLKI